MTVKALNVTVKPLTSPLDRDDHAAVARQPGRAMIRHGQDSALAPVVPAVKAMRIDPIQALRRE